jgi:hypothetical protein
MEKLLAGQGEERHKVGEALGNAAGMAAVHENTEEDIIQSLSEV